MLYTTIITFFGIYFTVVSSYTDVDTMLIYLKQCVARNDMNSFAKMLHDTRVCDDAFQELYQRFLQSDADGQVKNQGTKSKKKDILDFFVEYWYTYRSIPMERNYAIEAFNQLYWKWRKGNDVHATLQSRNLPIHVIIENEKTSLLKLYIDGQMQLDEPNLRHLTPLHVAVIFEIEEHVELLVNAGASVMLCDRRGKVPLDYAVERRNLCLIYKLCKRLTVSAMAYAVVSAFRTKNNAIIQHIFEKGIKSTLIYYKIKKFTENKELREHICKQRRLEMSPQFPKKSDLQYICDLGQRPQFKEWSDILKIFINIWYELLKRLLLIPQACAIIAVRLNDDVSQAIVKVCTIPELYLLITRRNEPLVSTNNACSAASLSEEIHIGMISEILERTTTIRTYNPDGRPDVPRFGVTCLYEPAEFPGKYVFQVETDATFPRWTMTDLALSGLKLAATIEGLEHAPCRTSTLYLSSVFSELDRTSQPKEQSAAEVRMSHTPGLRRQKHSSATLSDFHTHGHHTSAAYHDSVSHQLDDTNKENDHSVARVPERINQFCSAKESAVARSSPRGMTRFGHERQFPDTSAGDQEAHTTTVLGSSYHNIGRKRESFGYPDKPLPPIPRTGSPPCEGQENTKDGKCIMS